MYCHLESCLNFDAKLRCSECHYATYCSDKCQKKDWRRHKKECAMQKIVQEMNDKLAKIPKSKPRTTHCTGCDLKFTEDDPVDQECPDCGYLTCESCSCHNSRGTCDCKGSNFGWRYCSRTPKHYHAYSGDYHPDLDEVLDDGQLKEDMLREFFEAEARACNNCGEVRRCLKPNTAHYFSDMI
ncbi:uncharacterized protein C8R40DRAFT_1063898 [Lentinula edodes]|uniref:uncharacterized protein n=1 Tax=Lentinula edodes TaxID=5353 RepID=UPI001BF7AC77|nr:uncharacterized protein C8R40DRAFT_1063898 [Lentinula edodes]KAF8830032.1 hypothetical protein HHX47_DHR2000751 [Lentinula edodes]KAH7867721.1 hypothetical protein C8R40DRAFT_1063898 [Lentinula edodes]